MSERNPVFVELCEAIGYHAAQIAAEGKMAPGKLLMSALAKVKATLAAAPAQQPWQYTPLAQERIDALELEVRQLTEQIVKLRTVSHAAQPLTDAPTR